MTRAEALAALRAHLGSVMFQPESPTVPIQIAGLLEAAGQPFDALWVAGLTADEWPPAPRPNALLPVAWQRERNVPRSSAARELAYASALTAQFGRAAPDVVFSFAQHDAEHARTPSALLPDGARALDDGGGAPVPLAQAHFALRAPRECVADDAAPALKPGVEVRGGAGLIEAQSDCPFKATAVLRLRADPWPAPRDGLSPLERGTLVHETLAAFWAAVRSHGELDSMPREALEVAIGRAIEAAKAALPAGRWRGVAAPVREGESARIARLVREWIDDFERPRPAFAVSELEAERTLSLGGLPIRLRLDRIDALEDGGLAIIDYKTGRVRCCERLVRAPATLAATRSLRACAAAESTRRAVACGGVRTTAPRRSWRARARGRRARVARPGDAAFTPGLAHRGLGGRGNALVGASDPDGRGDRRGRGDGFAARPQEDVRALRAPAAVPDRRPCDRGPSERCR